VKQHRSNPLHAQFAWLVGAMITVPISISSPYQRQDSDAGGLGRSPKVSSVTGSVRTDRLADARVNC
jgi:hypothetical protein